MIFTLLLQFGEGIIINISFSFFFKAYFNGKVMYSYGPLHMAKQKQDDQPELTYSSYVKTQYVTLKTCRTRWIIGRSGERWSGISVLAARHDDDDDEEEEEEEEDFNGKNDILN